MTETEFSTFMLCIVILLELVAIISLSFKNNYLNNRIASLHAGLVKSMFNGKWDGTNRRKGVQGRRAKWNGQCTSISDKRIAGVIERRVCNELV